MSAPLNPSLILPTTLGGTEAAGAVRQAKVVGTLRNGTLVEAGRELWLLRSAGGKSAPKLEPGAVLRLQLSPRVTRGERPAQLIAVGGRRLEAPVQVRLQPAPAPPPTTYAQGGDLAASPRPTAPATSATQGAPLTSRVGVSSGLGRPGETPAPPAARGGAERAPSPVEALKSAAAALARETGGPGTAAARPDGGLAVRLLTLIRAIEAGGDPTPRVASRGASEPAGEPSGSLGKAAVELHALAREPLPGGWRILLLPFGGPADSQALRLYLRDDPSDDGGHDGASGKADDDAPRRAVFELDFSHLGRCQIDALCRGRRFDLVVRTSTALEADLEGEITALFAGACAAAGLHGELRFRPAELLPLPAPEPARGRAITT